LSESELTENGLMIKENVQAVLEMYLHTDGKKFPENCLDSGLKLR